MSDVVWEEPPPPAHGPGPTSKYLGLAAQLREHPGQWARLPVQLKAQQRLQILKTSPAFQPRHEWEFATRKAPDGTIVTYGRFVGNGHARDER